MSTSTEAPTVCGKSASRFLKFIQPDKPQPKDDIYVCDGCTLNPNGKGYRSYFGRGINPETETDKTCQALVYPMEPTA
jgi:hypothetical protein